MESKTFGQGAGSPLASFTIGFGTAIKFTCEVTSTPTAWKDFGAL